MPINFPSSPAGGDIYPYNGKNWRWSGSYWSASAFPPDVARQYYFLNAALLIQKTVEQGIDIGVSMTPIPTTPTLVTYI